MEITDENGDIYETESGLNNPWNFGVLVGTSLYKDLHFNTGLVLLEKGYWNYPAALRIAYLEIPVRLEYDLNIYKGISILPVGGFYGACGLWAGAYDISETYDQLVERYSFGNGSGDLIKRFDFGFSAGVALQWFLWGPGSTDENMGAGLRLNFLHSRSLIDLTPSEQPGTAKHRDFYIHFAIIVAMR